MKSNNSILGSIIKGTCPRCHGDQMFKNKNPYIITETMKMNDHCEKCGLKYEIEPNFFFGSMFVSYGLAVLAGILIFLVSHFIFKATLNNQFIAIVVGLVLLMPPIARMARTIYIALFVRYRPELNFNNKP